MERQIVSTLSAICHTSITLFQWPNPGPIISKPSLDIEDVVRSSSQDLLSRMVSHKRSLMRDMSPLAAMQGLFEGLTQTALYAPGCEVSGDGIPACPTLLQSLSECLTGTFVHTGISPKNK